MYKPLEEDATTVTIHAKVWIVDLGSISESRFGQETELRHQTK